MRRPRCQAENREGRRFCAECGASLAVTCPACGFLNEPGERFCGRCGAPMRSSPTVAPPKFGAPESYAKHLAEKILALKAALEGERKQVTVLFADLKGSMELLADRDPEVGAQAARSRFRSEEQSPKLRRVPWNGWEQRASLYRAVRTPKRKSKV